MLIDYGKNINKFYSNQVATFLGIMYPVYGTRTKDLIQEWFELIKQQYYPYPEKLDCLKEALDQEASNYFSSRKLTILKLREIYSSLSRYTTESDNLMMSLFRSWEWPYYTDDQMTSFNGMIADKIKNNEISLWKYSKCAYKGPLMNDLLEDLENQWENITEYCHKQGLKMIDLDRLKESVEILLDMIDGKGKIPPELRPTIRQWQKIRSKIPKVVKEMRRSEEEGMLTKSIMTKQSGSLWNSVPLLRETFKELGYGKITNVLGNFLASSKCILSKEFYSELIDVNNWIPGFDPNYLTLVCGKGDGFKIRYVGQTITIYQNYLYPLFKASKEVMEENPRIAVYDQETKYKEMCNNSCSMFGIDFSGYSDFLSRNVIKFILDYIYQLPSDISEKVMFILSLPVKIGDEYFEYLYGTLQGIMFDFNAITDSNQFMWALACIYSQEYDEATFCGDDRAEGKSTPYGEDFINNQMVVSICCNCVTNWSKTKSWDKDGYVSFCHIMIDKNKQPVSGLSANSYMKQKKFITDLNSVFKVFKKTGYWDLYDQSYWDKMIDLLIGNNDIIGNITDQYNLLHRGSRKDKSEIRNRLLLARTIPIEYGGLSCNDITEDLNLYLNVLRIQLLKYMEWDTEIRSEINYGFLEEENDQGIPLIDTRFGKALFNPSSTVVEIQETLKLIELCLDERVDKSRLDLDKLNKIKKNFTAIVRSIEYDGNVNKSVSTKNRVSVRMDSDKAFDNFIEAKSGLLERDKNFHLSSKGIMDFCFLDTIANLSNRRELFMYYLRYRELKSKYFGKIIFYEGFGGQTYLGYKGDHRDMIRLEVNSENFHNGRFYDFQSFKVLSKEEKEFLISFCSLHFLSKDSRMKYNINQNLIKSRIKSYLESEYLDIKRYASDSGLEPKDFFSVSHAIRISGEKDIDNFFSI